MTALFPPGLVLLLLMIFGCAAIKKAHRVQMGQQPQEINKKITKMIKGKYLLFLPKDYDTSTNLWPLMLFLHGAGERGSNLNLVRKHGPPRVVDEKPNFPFVLVSPQCPKDGWWTNPDQIEFLSVLLDEVTARYRIDPDRIYLTGLSMGGYGTWRLASLYPERFAAIAPVCGGGDSRSVRRIAHLPIWVFHGAKDETVQIKESEVMVNALQENGADVKFTVYQEAGHDSWTETYNNPALYDWFLSQTRQGEGKE